MSEPSDLPPSRRVRHLLELLWVAFAVVNLVWMWFDADWASVPFHFIWVSLTLLYGFRAWSRQATWLLLGFTVVTTGIVLLAEQLKGLRPADETLEVPLMAAMFLAMMLHADRRKKAIRELGKVSEHNQRLLERERIFVANASHELRTPITVALVHAELVARSDVDAATAEDVGIIADELERLRRLVDRLLLLAAVEEPQLLRPGRIDLTELLDGTLRRWAPVPRRWSVTRRDPAVVRADPDSLVLAVDALVENAVKFTTDGDLIELRVVRESGAAAIVVGDAGTGIPHARLESVFDRFSRADDSPAGRSGFGLGLSIVRAFAESNGGSVAVGGSPLGGAAVVLRLPLATDVPAARPVGPGADLADAVGSAPAGG